MVIDRYLMVESMNWNDLDNEGHWRRFIKHPQTSAAEEASSSEKDAANGL